MFASRQTTNSPAGAGLAENRTFSYQQDTRQISITNWKGPISNEPFNHSQASPVRSFMSLQGTTPVENVLQISPFYAKQTQFAGCSNEHKRIFNKALRDQPTPPTPQKQTQSDPISNPLYTLFAFHFALPHL